jgi:nitrogen-specific signal transduction histidine kinase
VGACGRDDVEKHLRDAQKAEVTGRLAGGVAHDFNNLLTVIRMSAARLKENLPSDRAVRELVTAIELAAQQASGLAQSLLTLSQDEAIQKEPVRLCAVVEESALLLRRALPPSVKLIVDKACEQTLWLRADRAQLHRVLLNLALNACDAMPTGGVLRMALGPAAESDVAEVDGASGIPASALARLSVSDTGVGLPPEDREKIFEPFFTTKARGGGTGLGLAVVREIIRDHGGFISVHSEDSKGVTFKVLLPRGEPAGGEVTRSAQHRGRGEGVLLAGTDAHLRGIVALALVSLGYRVLMADRPDAADAHLTNDRERIDVLVIVDSPSSGWLQWLRSLQAGPDKVPAIVIPAKGASASGRRLDGDTTVLHRPFEAAEVGAALDKLLHGRRSRREGTP